MKVHSQYDIKHLLIRSHENHSNEAFLAAIIYIKGAIKANGQ